jgi:hypothetical protein
MLSFGFAGCYAARQLGQTISLRSVYLNDLLRLLRRGAQAGTDINVDVVASVHHVGIVHCGGCLVVLLPCCCCAARGGELGACWRRRAIPVAGTSVITRHVTGRGGERGR